MREELVQQARARRHEGDLDGAIALLNRALASRLHDPEVVCDLASMLAERGRHERAERIFDYARSRHESLRLRLNHGTFLGQVGRLDESTELLAEVAAELRRLASRAARDGYVDVDGTPYDIDEVAQMLAAAECNLGQAELDRGDPATALERVRPWLSDPMAWTHAHDVLADCLEDHFEEPRAAAEQLLHEGATTPVTVAVMVDAALDEDDCEHAFELLLAADRALFAGWSEACEEIAEAIARTRVDLRRGLMRGRIGQDVLERFETLDRFADEEAEADDEAEG